MFGVIDEQPGQEKVLISSAVSSHQQEGSPNMQSFLQLNDLTNAQRFIRQFGYKVRYVLTRGWYLFDGVRWSLDDSDQILNLACTSLQSYYEEVSTMSGEQCVLCERLLKHVERSSSLPRLNAFLKIARTLPGVTLSYAHFDADPYLLSVLNGTLNLRNATLQPHNPEDYITRLLPVDYDPLTYSSVWDSFLARLTDQDIALQQFLQRAIGYSLTGQTREAACFLLTGPGYQAHKLLLSLLGQLFGDYAGHLPSVYQRDLTSTLLQSRLLTTSTAAFLSSRSYVTLANIIEAEPVTLKHIIYKPLSKLWISTPNAPDIPAKLVYLCEHIKLIPISLNLSPQEAYLLECQLQTALPAILAWAVQGCLQWQQQGLLVPESIKEANSVYREEQDVLAPFLETCCVQDSSLSIRAHELHQAYLLWSRLQDAPRLSEQHFSQLIRAHSFYRSKQSSGYYYHGLALKTPLSQLSSEIKQISPLLIEEQPIYSAPSIVKIG